MLSDDPDDYEGIERVAPGEIISLGAYLLSLTPNSSAGADKPRANKRNERAKKKRELDTRNAVGRDNFLVKRRKADGEVSDKDSRNKFITVGSVH